MNVFQYAATCEANFEANLAEVGNYKRFTTFYYDLSIAEFSGGAKAVKDTFKNVVKSWLNDYKYFTEFVLSLNYKSWEWNARRNGEFVELYSELFYKAKDLFYNHYEGNEEANEYFFEVTD